METTSRMWIMALLMAMGFALTACSDKDEFPEDENPDDEQAELVEIPTEDKMTETCKVPVVVIGSGFSDVAEAVVRRIENPQTELSENAKVIFFKGEDIYSFSDADFRTIGKAYDKGAILAIDQPKEKHILDLALKIAMPEFEEGFSGEEHDVPFADFIAYNTPRNKQYILHDIFDDDPVTVEHSKTETSGEAENGSITKEESEPVRESRVHEEFTLAPYTAGLYADEICKWFNRLDEAAPGGALAAFQASRGNSLDQLTEAQEVTKTYSFVPYVPDDAPATKQDVANHCVPITVNYFIYCAYSYSRDTDYYMIDQEISICSSPIWRGTGNDEKGIVLTEVKFDASLLDGNGKSISRNNGCTILQHSPNTTTGSQTITTTSSFSLSGNVGLTPSGPSMTVGGGISWGVNHASTLPDVSVINNSMDNSEQNNAKWTYSVQYNDAYFPGIFKKASFGSTPEVAKSTFHTYNSWIWQVDRPESHKPDFSLRVNEFKISYRLEKFTSNNIFRYNSRRWNYGPSYNSSFKLVSPNRK